MTLDQYLSEHRLTHAEMAARIGVHQTTISKLRRGKHDPTFELLRKIAEATGGAVTPNDFLGAPQPEGAAA